MKKQNQLGDLLEDMDIKSVGYRPFDGPKEKKEEVGYELYMNIKFVRDKPPRGRWSRIQAGTTQ